MKGLRKLGEGARENGVHPVSIFCKARAKIQRELFNLAVKDKPKIDISEAGGVGFEFYTLFIVVHLLSLLPIHSLTHHYI
jgi:hypothetical protein